MKYPDWTTAPEWANWVACNKNGRWVWFEKQPSLTITRWRSPKRRQSIVYSGLNHKASVKNPNWQNSLQPRPFAPSWDDAPDWAVYAIQEKNSSGNWYWQEKADRATGIRAATNPYPDWHPKKTTLLRRPTDRPDWSEAPSWANWIAQDKDGEWRWHETEPKIQEAAYLNDLHTSDKRVQSAKFGEPHPGWKENVVRRPENTKSQNNKPSWDDAPDEATHLAQDKNGMWFWYRQRPAPRDNHYDMSNCMFPNVSQGPENPNWRNTVEARPQPKTPNNKPSWDNAPSWAQWTAQDQTGEWWWYEHRPAINQGHYCWDTESPGKTECQQQPNNNPQTNPDWRSTLESRPEVSQPEVSESIEKVVELLPGLTLRLSIRVIQKAQ